MIIYLFVKIKPNFPLIMTHIKSHHKFILKLHPSDIIQKPYQKISSIQKLNFYFDNCKESIYLFILSPRAQPQILNLKIKIS